MTASSVTAILPPEIKPCILVFPPSPSSREQSRVKKILRERERERERGKTSAFGKDCFVDKIIFFVYFFVSLHSFFRSTAFQQLVTPWPFFFFFFFCVVEFQIFLQETSRRRGRECKKKGEAE